LNKFQYRGINDATVFMTETENKLIQNYQGAFLQLLTYYRKNNDKENYRRVWRRFLEVLPEERLPFPNEKVKGDFEGWLY